jgi:carbamoylphosphate synthase large subunit
LSYRIYSVIGQDTEQIQKYDDKDYTNRLLAKSGLSLPAAFLVSENIEQENLGEKIVALEKLDMKAVGNFGIYLLQKTKKQMKRNLHLPNRDCPFPLFLNII